MAQHDDSYDMYRELMELSGGFGSDPSYEPEEEGFVTSKEVSEQQKQFGEDAVKLPYAGAKPIEIEEEVHFKRYTKQRKHKYTETELRQIRESCRCTIVHDYGAHDVYHMSDEERRENDVLNELSLKLGSLKRTYHQIDQYIYAMRIVVQAWEILERNNFMHPAEEFFQMVSEGKIVSDRILMPKMRRIQDYNMDMIIRYISDPSLDPTDLIPTEAKNHSRYEDEEDITDTDEYLDILGEITARYQEEGVELTTELQEQILEEAITEYEDRETKRLLSSEEIEWIHQHAESHGEKMRVQDVNPKWIHGYDQRSGKHKKKMSKKKRYHLESLHDLLNKIQGSYASRGMASSYLITHGIFEPEEKAEDPFQSLRFCGSWADEDAVKLYEIALQERMMEQRVPGDAYSTYADAALLRFFRTLEENDINVVELRRRMNRTDESVNAAIETRKKRDNKKKEAALIQRIMKLNGDKKFKKTVAKAEKEINEHIEDYE